MADIRPIPGKLLPLTLIVLAAGGCGESSVTGTGGLEGDDGASAPILHAVSPGEIVFSTGRNGNSELYAMNADGSDPVNLTNHPHVDWRPAWSPDGTRVAFERAAPGGSARSVIYAMSADGSSLVELMADGSQPAWSPDGARIAFWRIREDDSWWGLTTDIWVMDADGSDPVRLVMDAWYPAWSPDGAKIAFAASGLLKIMGAGGSSPTFLHTGTHPAWSPDGSKIAYSDDGDIWVMGADGSNPVNLTNHPAFDWTPVWSPDGTRIVFVTERDGNREIYIMGADGSNPVNLTNHPAQDQTPAWAPVVPSGSPARTARR